jgi:hypothetical protein
MKRKTFIFILALAGLTVTHAQYANRYQVYSPPFKVCAGVKQTLSKGYAWWGYFSSGAPNFAVSGYSPLVFNNTQSYIVSAGGSNCTGGLSAVNNCAGVSVIETNALSGSGRYAVAGAYNDGVYFILLNSAAATVVSSKLFPFPWLSASTINKPLIVEEGTSNNYYICGTFDNRMYIIKIDVWGNVLWSGLYQVGTSTTPGAILHDPFNPQQLVVVGSVLNPPMSSCAGQFQYPFFMKVDENNGNSLLFNLYSSNCSYNGRFSSIIASNNSAFPSSYVIGGGVDPTPGIGKSWLTRLGTMGNPLWSSLVGNSGAGSSNFSGPVISLIERPNTLGTYEFHALTASSLGMTVLKLDDMGDPFPISSPNALYNEFNYDMPATLPAEPVAISYNTSASWGDIGLQVLGTDDGSFSPGSVRAAYCVSAYFNGETNCNKNLTQLTGSSAFPANPTPFTPATIMNIFNGCNNFAVSVGGGNNSLNIPCQGNMSSGSNQRVTGIGYEDANEMVSLYPNPLAERATLSFQGFNNTPVNIRLFNSIGQKVADIEEITEQAPGRMMATIDVQALGLVPGVYFLEADINQVTTRIKLVCTR